MRMASASTPISIFEEIADVIASGAGRESLLRYRPSPAAQERASELLEKNRQGTLTEDERDELDEFVQADEFMRLLKARLRSRSRAT